MKRTDPSQDQDDVGQDDNAHAVQLVAWHIWSDEHHKFGLHEGAGKGIAQISHAIHIVDMQPAEDR